MNEFDDCIKVVKGYKDAFNKPFLLLLNSDLKEIRFVAKYNDYIKKRNYYKKNYPFVVIQKYGEVIDVTKDTYEKIRKKYKDYKMPCFLNIWN